MTRFRARLWRWTAAVNRFGGRAWDVFPFTLFGLLALVSGALSFKFWAEGSMDVVLRVVSLGAVALVLVALVLVVPVALALKWRGPPDWPGEVHLETGCPLVTGASLPWLGWLPLVTVAYRWQSPTGVGVFARRRGLQVREVVVPRVRGTHQQLVRAVRVQDVLGLAKVVIRWRQPVALTIVPRIGALRRLQVLRSFAGGDEWPHPMGLDDGDRVELRRYVAGDPSRFIHWKIFGRTRRLMVRMPERALSRADRTAAFLVAGPRDDASAAVALMAVESGGLGVDWVFSADGSDRPCTTASAARRAIVASKHAGVQGGHHLLEFVRQAERQGPTSVVVFAPASEGPWLDRVLALHRHRPQGFRVVIAVDGVRGNKTRHRWMNVVRKLAFRSDPSETTGEWADAADLAMIAAKLNRPQLDVMWVNRTSGRPFRVSPADGAVLGAGTVPRVATHAGTTRREAAGVG